MEHFRAKPGSAPNFFITAPTKSAAVYCRSTIPCASPANRRCSASDDWMQHRFPKLARVTPLFFI